MIDPWIIILASLAYVGLLFAIAWWGDRRAESGRSLVRNPVVYTLSIAVYCTSWTFFGAVGSAALRGPEFLTIYLGPTLVFLAWWLLLRKIVRITRAHRITSIADFISSRYGKSTSLSVLVTVIAIAGTMPYIALQLKAVATSYTVLISFQAMTGVPEPGVPATLFTDTAFWVAAAMAAFAILFGTRHIDASEHHEGVVTAIAFESLVKMMAFLAVGVFAAWGINGGFAHPFSTADGLDSIVGLSVLGDPEAAPRWVTTLLLSMCAIVCLPRQFQVMAVEAVDERHLSTAAWLFPLYLFVLSLFIAPIALAGLSTLPEGANADSFVLTVPLAQGQEMLALLAFLGGLSAATGMVIVAAISLSTMICNDLIMPALLRIRWLRLTQRGDLTRLLLAIRRTAIVVLLFLGYAYYRLTGQSGGLAAIGLISFAAAAQFAPPLLAGLFWKSATKAGAITGLLLGFLAWLYTLLLPSFARSGWIAISFVEEGPLGLTFLRPEALFFMDRLDPLSHALFWSWLFNIGALVLVSLFTGQSVIERVQATVFVDVFRRRDTATPQVWKHTVTVGDLQALAQRFLGRKAAHRAVREFEARHGVTLQRGEEAHPELVTMVERLLAGSIGGASARVMVASVAKGEMVSLEKVLEILEETSQVIRYSRKLEDTTAELREANRRLTKLDELKDEFLSTVSHELRTPLTSIRSFSEILVDNPSLERAEIDRFLGIIVAESERLTRLINQLLDLARLEAGHGDWQLASTDLPAVLEDALSVTAGLFTEKGVALDRRISAQAARVLVDRDRLMQVFVNLLSNAVKFSAQSGGRVEVSAQVVDRAWQVAVADNGPGIPAGEREVIFDKFVKAKAQEGSGRPNGTGLGLSISRQIIERFGGRIWVEAAPSGGARFVVSLPLDSRDAGWREAGRRGAGQEDARPTPRRLAGE